MDVALLINVIKDLPCKECQNTGYTVSETRKGVCSTLTSTSSRAFQQQKQGKRGKDYLKVPGRGMKVNTSLEATKATHLLAVHAT